jgi:hypothetical protein
MLDAPAEGVLRRAAIAGVALCLFFRRRFLEFPACFLKFPTLSLLSLTRYRGACVRESHSVDLNLTRIKH